MKYAFRVYSHFLSPILEEFGLQRRFEEIYYKCRRHFVPAENISIGGVEKQFDSGTIPEDGYKELPVLKDFLDELRPHDTFFDIGAAGGWYACFATDSLNKASIVCFEPDFRGRQRLKNNLARNSCDAVVYPVGLSNKRTEVDLPNNGQCSLIPGDSLVQNDQLPQPSIVKIDVEGGEGEVIEGLKHTLSDEQCRTVYCELHNIQSRGFEGSKESVRDSLERLGFEISEIHRRYGDGFEQPFIKGVK